MEPLQMNDEPIPSDMGRALPLAPSSPANSDLTSVASNGPKSTLYLGTFQVIAMPFSPGSIPPNMGSNIPNIAPPSKKD